MKKLFCVLLVLSFLVPLACAQADNTAAYVGTWVYYQENQVSGDISIEVLHLNRLNTAYYIFEEFNGGKAVRGAKRVGTWKMNDDGNGIFIDLGNKDENKYNAVCSFEELAVGIEVKSLKERKAKTYVAIASDILSKMTDEKLTATPAPTATPEPVQQVDGLRVPQGEYIVGDLIPAGRYLVTLSNDDLAVIWVKKPGQIGSDYYSLVYSTGETEAYIVLEEGGTFRVQHSTVILSEPKGF